MTTKYIFVTGGVVSSLGKGISAASLGRLLTVMARLRDPQRAVWKPEFVADMQ